MIALLALAALAVDLTPSNVSQLHQAWVFHTAAKAPNARAAHIAAFEDKPVFADGCPISLRRLIREPWSKISVRWPWKAANGKFTSAGPPARTFAEATCYARSAAMKKYSGSPGDSCSITAYRDPWEEAYKSPRPAEFVTPLPVLQ